jgi:hypothetical protein
MIFQNSGGSIFRNESRDCRGSNLTADVTPYVPVAVHYGIAAFSYSAGLTLFAHVITISELLIDCRQQLTDRRK